MCVECGGEGSFETTLLRTTRGPMHDVCWFAMDDDVKLMKPNGEIVP